MRRISQGGMLLLLVAAVILSACVSFLVARNTHALPPQDDGKTEMDFHDWVHANLEITPDQEAALKPFEAEYAENQRTLEERILEAGSIVAHAMEPENAETESFETALRDLNATQGELQKLTMQHFLDMKRHLSPEQTEKLLRWVHDSIGHEH